MVENKGFQMGPLPSIFRIGAVFTIRFKGVYFDPFSPYYVNWGDRV